jgi:hypothetical protein
VPKAADLRAQAADSAAPIRADCSELVAPPRGGSAAQMDDRSGPEPELVRSDCRAQADSVADGSVARTAADRYASAAHPVRDAHSVPADSVAVARSADWKLQGDYSCPAGLQAADFHPVAHSQAVPRAQVRESAVPVAPEEQLLPALPERSPAAV